VLIRSARSATVALVIAVALGLPAPATAPSQPLSPARPSSSAAVTGSSRPSVAGESGPGSAAPSSASAASPSATPSAPDAASPSVTGLIPGAVDRSSYALSVTYDADVTLHYGDRLLRVASIMTLTNASGGPIDRIELNTIAARLGGLHAVTGSVAGKAVTVSVVDQTLVVPLGGVLADGATVQARIAYTAHLRSDLAGSNWMFTRVNGVIDAYRWLPWASRTIPFNRPNHGDPFITPTSPSVRVRITTDRPLVLATTGDRVSATGLTQTFVAENVRDFTITAAPDYRTASSVVAGTTIEAFYRAGGPGAAMLSAAKSALSKMSALVGTYPYRTFKVVQSAGGYGLESPQLIWVPTGVASVNLPYLVHHETAHQWFYGLVGSNQAYEPFTDEAAADFLARYAFSQRRASGCAAARLDLSIYGYSSTCYYEDVYIQGGNFLDDLRRRIGSSAFWAGLREYVAAHRYGMTTTKQLLDALDDATPLDLVPAYRARFPRIY
jgi:hypothetical protein